MLFDKKAKDIKIITFESWNGLYEVAVRVCMESANITVHMDYKPCPRRLGHCGNDTPRE